MSVKKCKALQNIPGGKRVNAIYKTVSRAKGKNVGGGGAVREKTQVDEGTSQVWRSCVQRRK